MSLAYLSVPFTGGNEPSIGPPCCGVRWKPPPLSGLHLLSLLGHGPWSVSLFGPPSVSVRAWVTSFGCCVPNGSVLSWSVSFLGARYRTHSTRPEFFSCSPSPFLPRASLVINIGDHSPNPPLRPRGVFFSRRNKYLMFGTIISLTDSLSSPLISLGRPLV